MIQGAKRLTDDNTVMGQPKGSKGKSVKESLMFNLGKTVASIENEKKTLNDAKMKFGIETVAATQQQLAGAQQIGTMMEKLRDVLFQVQLGQAQNKAMVQSAQPMMDQYPALPGVGSPSGALPPLPGVGAPANLPPLMSDSGAGGMPSGVPPSDASGAPPAPFDLGGGAPSGQGMPLPPV